MLTYIRETGSGFPPEAQLKETLYAALAKLGTRKKVLVIPPDFTRYHSQAGYLTELVCSYYGDAVKAVLPALGTHVPMTDGEIAKMFGSVPKSLFRVHNWRTDGKTLGEVPSEFVKEVSEGRVDYPWPVQVNKLLASGDFDLLLSVGQVVPHEVIGMANYNKNIFVGTGGPEGINRSHFLGAAYGMERMMGRVDTPVRKVLNYGASHFTAGWPLVYIHSVIARDQHGRNRMKGLFIGDDDECFLKAAELSLAFNFILVEKPLKKVVVYLDPSEFRSTWLGNKSIYRTRMAIADGGELIVMAPGAKEFGEDKEIDRLIRKYGYADTPGVLDAVKKNPELQNNLSAAAHLIHGSTEGRFRVTWCPGFLTRDEIEGVNYQWGNSEIMMKKYDPSKLKDGLNNVDGEEIYFISNPATGLWAHSSRFVD
ncbi:MAG: lactate racemase domain-containing protein [Bacteroidales bacterium]